MRVSHNSQSNDDDREGQHIGDRHKDKAEGLTA